MRQASLPGCLQVGGLRDTVQQFSPYDNTGTGWTFEWADGGNFRCASATCRGISGAAQLLWPSSMQVVAPSWPNSSSSSRQKCGYQHAHTAQTAS